MNTQKLLIPCGYNVEQHNETVDIATAGQILSSRKQRRYSWAIRHEWQANLTRHVWVCPHCNAHIPAYPEYFGKRSSFEKTERPVVADWATLQLPLFEEPDKELHFNAPFQNGKMVCPECMRESERNPRSKNLVFSKKKHYLSRDRNLHLISMSLCADFWAIRGDFMMQFLSPITLAALTAHLNMSLKGFIIPIMCRQYIEKAHYLMQKR